MLIIKYIHTCKCVHKIIFSYVCSYAYTTDIHKTANDNSMDKYVARDIKLVANQMQLQSDVYMNTILKCPVKLLRTYQPSFFDHSLPVIMM